MAEDDRAAREAVKPALATTLAWMANQPQQPMFTDYGLTPEDADVMRQSYTRGELRPDFVSDAMVDELALAGSPQRCREQLTARIEAGRSALEVVAMKTLPIDDPPKAIDYAQGFAEVGVTHIVHTQGYESAAEYRQNIAILEEKIRPALAG